MSRELKGLTAIESVSGTAEDGGGCFRGFVTVRALAEDGSMFSGQLDPAAVRRMALQFLETAEAAEQDAIVFSVMARDGIPLAAIGAFVGSMRAEREA